MQTEEAASDILCRDHQGPAKGWGQRCISAHLAVCVQTLLSIPELQPEPLAQPGVQQDVELEPAEGCGPVVLLCMAPLALIDRDLSINVTHSCRDEDKN